MPKCYSSGAAEFQCLSVWIPEFTPMANVFRPRCKQLFPPENSASPRDRADAVRAICHQGRGQRRLRGVAIILGEALAEKLGVPAELIAHNGSGEMQNSGGR